MEMDEHRSDLNYYDAKNVRSFRRDGPVCPGKNYRDPDHYDIEKQYELLRDVQRSGTEAEVRLLRMPLRLFTSGCGSDAARDAEEVIYNRLRPGP